MYYRAISVLLVLCSLMMGCSKVEDQTREFDQDNNKLKVIASFYPLYELTKIVGSDKVDVIQLVPAGVEPHHWEPTTKHIRLINQAGLFVFNGAGLEHWVKEMPKSVDNKDLVWSEVSKGFKLIKGADGVEEWDPHIWLNPMGVIHQVEVIREALVRLDTPNRNIYETNARAYIEQLRALDDEMRTELRGCKTRKLFTSHAAFGYLAQRYELEQHPIMGLSPDAEPQPKQMAQIVVEARANDIKYIFFETMASDKVARAVANEIGAKTLVLNPFEGLTDEEMKTGKTYLTVMRENLKNLKIGLECGK